MSSVGPLNAIKELRDDLSHIIGVVQDTVASIRARRKATKAFGDKLMYQICQFCGNAYPCSRGSEEDKGKICIACRRSGE